MFIKALPDITYLDSVLQIFNITDISLAPCFQTIQIQQHYSTVRPNFVPNSFGSSHIDEPIPQHDRSYVFEHEEK